MLVEAPSCGMNSISIQRSQSFQNDNSKNLNNKSSNALLEVTDEKFIRLMLIKGSHLV